MGGSILMLHFQEGKITNYYWKLRGQQYNLNFIIINDNHKRIAEQGITSKLIEFFLNRPKSKKEEKKTH